MLLCFVGKYKAQINSLTEQSADEYRTESAWQAVSYGLNSVKIFAQVGGVYLNFGLWAVALVPAWLVVRHFGNDAIAAASEGDDTVAAEKFSNSETASNHPIEQSVEEKL
jgi:hypothetical protein